MSQAGPAGWLVFGEAVAAAPADESALAAEADAGTSVVQFIGVADATLPGRCVAVSGIRSLYSSGVMPSGDFEVGRIAFVGRTGILAVSSLPKLGGRT